MRVTVHPGSWLQIALSLCVCGVALCVTADDEFDRLEVTGRQLLVNGSFEDLVRGHERPDGWDVFKTVWDSFSLITDARTSHHGTRYIRFAPPDHRILYGKLRSAPRGRHRVSVWVRGQGSVSFCVDVRRDDYRSLPPDVSASVKEATSPVFDVSSSEWQRLRWEFELPSDFTGADGSPLNVSGSLKIRVAGDLMLDECSVAPRPAATVAATERPKTAREGSAAGNKAASDLPRVTIPKLAAAPVADGRIEPGEWAGALAVTGFLTLNNQVLAERQAVAYLAYTESHVHVAFSCPVEGRVSRERLPRDTMGGNETHGVEVWLVPPGQRYYQFLTCPGPGKMDARLPAGKSWNGEWEVRDSVQDVPEEIGGILSFRKKLWTTELAIPFTTLGVTEPEMGEWRLNVTRNWAAPQGQKRSSRDWTTWSPLTGSFRRPEQFAFATFAPAPAVQVTRLSDLSKGELGVSGNCDAGANQVCISATALLPGSGKTLSHVSAEFSPGAGPAELQLSHDLQTNETQVLHYRVQAEDMVTGKALLSQTIPFVCTAALQLRAIPAFSRDELVVEVDTSRVADLPEAVTVTSRLLQGDRLVGAVKNVVWPRARTGGTVTHPLRGLEAGMYRVDVAFRAAGSEAPLTGAVASFDVPGPQPWTNSTLGLTGDVPRPWAAVEVDGRRVVVTEREYVLGGVGLPGQIAALGKELFAAPPELRLVIDGRERRWDCEPPRLTSRTSRAAVWRLAAAASGLRLTGTLTVEFDGFALWQFEIAAPAPVAVESLSIDFPFKRNRSLYAQATNPRLSDRGALVAMLNGSGNAQPLPIAGVRYSGNGWRWPTEWCCRHWVGDDARGLSVLTETDEPLIGTRRSEVLRGDGRNTLRIYLVDGPAELTGKRAYTYMWQATPVKPRPSDPRLWHACYANNSLKQWLARYQPEECAVALTLDMWCLKQEGWPALHLPERSFLKRNKILMDAGVRLVPYFGTNIATIEFPETRAHLAEWETIPASTHANPRGRWAVCCPQNPGFSDFKLWCQQRIITDLPLQGLYLDVSNVTACANHHHGCGWKNTEGEWLSTVPILANRRLYQRMHVVNKRDGRDCVLFRHGMPWAPIAGYVDVVTQGEDWCREGALQYDRLTPEIFRAKTMRQQYGTPFTWYCFHHYWRGVRHGGRVPLATMLAYCLPHYTLITDGHPGMWKTWQATDPFWTSSRFLPYWRDDCPVSTDVENVLASVYLKAEEKQALLVVANWSREPRDVRARIDFAALGFGGNGVHLSRAIEHPILGPDDRPDGDTMPNAPLVLNGDTLPLSIHGRNLEVLLLAAE